MNSIGRWLWLAACVLLVGEIASGCAPGKDLGRVELPLKGRDAAARPLPREAEAAYEHNRAGMVNMSMARFEEAIEEFRQAASLLEDYAILDRPLVYTPIFMMGWAYEKLGQTAEACREFKKFLEIASPDLAEPGKVFHARSFLDACRG